MVRLDVPHRAGSRAHDHGVRGGAVAVVVDAPEQRAVGDAGGGEEDVLPRDQVVEREDIADVVAGTLQLVALLVVPRVQAALHLTAQALQGARRDDALGCAADPQEHVDAGVRTGGGDGRRHVAVGDEVHAGPHLPARPDHLLVALAVQDHDGDLLGPDPLRPSHSPHVLLRRRRDVDRADGVRPCRDLLHVHGGPREEHRVPLRHGYHRERVGLADARQTGPVDGIDRDVHRRAGAVADLLPVEEHRRLVLLALPDHHHAVHGHRVQHEPHRVDGRTVGGVLVTAPDPPRRGQGRGLRHAHDLEGKVAVGTFLAAHNSTSRISLGSAFSNSTR